MYHIPAALSGFRPCNCRFESLVFRWKMIHFENATFCVRLDFHVHTRRRYSELFLANCATESTTAKCQHIYIIHAVRNVCWPTDFHWHRSSALRMHRLPNALAIYIGTKGACLAHRRVHEKCTARTSVCWQKRKRKTIVNLLLYYFMILWRRQSCMNVCAVEYMGCVAFIATTDLLPLVRNEFATWRARPGNGAHTEKFTWKRTEKWNARAEWNVLLAALSYSSVRWKTVWLIRAHQIHQNIDIFVRASPRADENVSFSATASAACTATRQWMCRARRGARQTVGVSVGAQSWQIKAITITTIQTTAKVCTDSAYNSFDIVLQLVVYQAKFTELLQNKISTQAHWCYSMKFVFFVCFLVLPLDRLNSVLYGNIHNYCIYTNYIRLKCHLQLICTITTITSMFNGPRRAINACNESGKKRADANKKNGKVFWRMCRMPTKMARNW